MNRRKFSYQVALVTVLVAALSTIAFSRLWPAEAGIVALPWDTHGNAGTTPDSGTQDFIGTTDAQPLAFRTNDVERMRLDTSGNVGIGTAFPVAKLQVTSGSYSTTLDNVGVAALTFGNNLYWTGSAWNLIDTSVGGTMLQMGTDRSFSFRSAAAGSNPVSLPYSAYIDASGNVGIGTTNPQSPLQIVGYAQLDLVSGAPAAADCNAAPERGRMIVDNAGGMLYVCMDSGWVAK